MINSWRLGMNTLSPCSNQSCQMTHLSNRRTGLWKPEMSSPPIAINACGHGLTSLVGVAAKIHNRIGGYADTETAGA